MLQAYIYINLSHLKRDVTMTIVQSWLEGGTSSLWITAISPVLTAAHRYIFTTVGQYFSNSLAFQMPI